MDAHFWKCERKGCAMAVYFWHSDSLGAGRMPCQLTWAHLQHRDWVKGEKDTWLSQMEGLQGWQFPAAGCGCQGSYLVCMFGKRLCAGHHAGSPFVQLAQLLSPLVQGDACASQVPNDPARGSSHAFNPTWSRDVLGEAARGFSCRGLANCKGEKDRQTDRQTGMSSWPGSVSAPQPQAAALQQWCHSMGTCGRLCSVTITSALQSCAPHSAGQKKLPRWRNYGMADKDPPLPPLSQLSLFINHLHLVYYSIPRWRGQGISRTTFCQKKPWTRNYSQSSSLSKACPLPPKSPLRKPLFWASGVSTGVNKSPSMS